MTLLAANIPGLTLEESPRDKHWLQLVYEGTDIPDLILMEWGRDARKASADGIIAELGAYRPRLKSAKSLLPGLQSVPASEKAGIYPVATYCWGLFYNPAILEKAGVKPPVSWSDFTSALPKIKASGAAPIALGSSTGWPALSWLSYLDIRLNGPEAHAGLYSGKRSFGDASMDKVYETLKEWRDSGWFVPSQPAGSWSDSLAQVEFGRAAFVLMGTFAIPRFLDPEQVRWMPLPSAGAKKGEIVVSQGFALASKAANPEAAMAFADAYVAAGSPGIVADSFRIPVVVSKVEKKAKGDADPYSLASVKMNEAELLRSEKSLFPQLDRYVQAQEAGDASQAMARFFSADAPASVDDLKAALGAIKL
ncbi:MAG: ABC transporter substrate-binding protein [Spirochaetaceae bacterium]|nr:ABC transporter substrate-binding protein [Spirochaetaceae bacterium]